MPRRKDYDEDTLLRNITVTASDNGDVTERIRQYGYDAEFRKIVTSTQTNTYAYGIESDIINDIRDPTMLPYEFAVP